MKRFLLLALLAMGLAGVFESAAVAGGRIFAGPVPAGVGGQRGRVNRINGYWQQPSRGPLYDYSSYFATMYPWLPGAQEYQGQPAAPGQFGTVIAVLPTASPPRQPATPGPAAPARTLKIEIQPQPPK